MNTTIELPANNSENKHLMAISQPLLDDNFYKVIDTSCHIAPINNFSFGNEIPLAQDQNFNHESIVLSESCEENIENVLVCKIDDTPFECAKNREKSSLECDGSTLPSVDLTKTYSKQFKCDVCNALYPSMRTLFYHLIKSHDIQNNLHMCPFCYRECWSEKELTNHLSKHHGVMNKHLSCAVCGMQLSSKSELKAHERKHIPNHQCPACPKKFAAKYLLALHVKEHIASLKPFKCPVCGRRFKNSKAIFLHEWRHMPQNCVVDDCYYKFEDESYLLVHLKDAHKYNEPKENQFLFVRDKLDCTIDSYLSKFTKLFALKTCRNNISKLENSSFLKFVMQKDDLFNDTENWKILRQKVKLCNLNFDSICELKNKFENILQSKDGRKFSDENDTISELENIIFPEKAVHLFSLCKQDFDSKVKPNIHLSRCNKNHSSHISCSSYLNEKFQIHNPRCSSPDLSSPLQAIRGKSLAKCTRMNKKTNILKHRWKKAKKKGSALSHLKECTKKNKHGDAINSLKSVCPICEKVFISKLKLSQHLKTHCEAELGKLSEGMFKCPKCSKVFKKRQMLHFHLVRHDVEHRRSHCKNVHSSCSKVFCHLDSKDKQLRKRFPCNRCDLKFMYKSQLRVHLLIHTGEKPFVCDWCGKRFKRLQQCKVHENIVHNENRVQCNECLKYFGTTSNLLRHQIAFHMNLKRWICGICGNSYGYSQNLRCHLKKVHQFELDNIGNKSKKSLSEIYIIPPLGTVKISQEIKQKIEAMYREESDKCKHVNPVIFDHSSEDAPKVVNITSNNEGTSAPNLIVPFPIEVESIKECGYCKWRIDDYSGSFKCDACNIVLCSANHMHMHVSEVHNMVFQCFLCNTSFLSKELCLSHIEKSHSYSSLYPNGFQPNNQLSCIVNKEEATGVSVVPQMLPVSIFPQQSPVFQLVTVPNVELAPILNLVGPQDGTMFIPNSTNKELMQGVQLNPPILGPLQAAPVQINNTLNFNKLVPDVNSSVVETNSGVLIAGGYANTLPTVNLPPNAAKLSDCSAYSVSVPTIVEDISRIRSSVGTLALQGSEQGLHEVKNEGVDNLYNLSTISIAGECSQLDACKVQNFQDLQIINGSVPIFTSNEAPKNSLQGQVIQATGTTLPTFPATLVDTSLLPLGNLQNEGSSIIPIIQDVYENNSGVNKLGSFMQNKIQVEKSEETNPSQRVLEETQPALLPPSFNMAPGSCQTLCDLRCTTCFKSFLTPLQLERHKRIHAPKMHQCEVCDKSFVEKFNLKTHMMSHTQEKPRQCQKCNKKFRYFRDLKDHQRSHEGLIPFQCDFCPVKFSRRKDLIRHEKEQHGEAKFRCLECGREFKRKSYLKIHMRVHRYANSEELS